MPSLLKLCLKALIPKNNECIFNMIIKPILFYRMEKEKEMAGSEVIGTGLLGHFSPGKV